MGYRLDHKPSTAQRRLLWSLAEGCQVALHPDGSYRVRQTDEVVPAVTLRACLDQHWISGMPGRHCSSPIAGLRRAGSRPSGEGEHADAPG